MNYIAELNAFYDWLETNQCSAEEIALWHILMAINNRTGWTTEFTVANLTLQAKAGLSRKQLNDYRLKLSQKGRIVYTKSGKPNQAGKYSLVSFDTQRGTQEGTRTGTQTGTREEHERDTLFKQNKTKPDDDKARRLFAAYQEIFQNGMNAIQREDLIEYMDKGMEVDLMILDFKKAVRNNAGFSYAFKTIQNHFQGGIKTIADYEAHESRRQTAAGGVSYELTIHNRQGKGAGGPNGRSRSITGGKTGRV